MDLPHPVPDILCQQSGILRSVAFSIAQPSCQELEFVRRGFREHQVGRISANDPKAIDNISKEEVTDIQRGVVGFANYLQTSQAFKCAQSPGQSDLRMLRSIQQLQY